MFTEALSGGLWSFLKTDQPAENGGEQDGLQSEAERRFIRNSGEAYYKGLLTVWSGIDSLSVTARTKTYHLPTCLKGCQAIHCH